jgi:hypothetical protein|uniref:N-acetylmuramoyl-L-alanine amidase-like domain-containing protein n=1 Tax=Algoriphagus sp. TaxID=1872435 RepID=UPI004048AC89
MMHLRFFLLLFCFPFLSYSQTVCDLESKKRIEEISANFQGPDYASLTSGDLIAAIGNQFLGTPYVGKTLELPGEEQLVINLMEVDCTTFVETVLALTITIKQGASDFQKVAATLEQMRYLNGSNTGYGSRLHYFSDWIFENEKAGRLIHLSKSLGGIKSPNTPSFMSANPNSYSQLADPKNLASILEREVVLASREMYFIPKEKIHLIENQLQNGDIVAITTTIKNLDVVHAGFVVKQGEGVHLMHASSVSKKVVISSVSLQEYLMQNRSQTGILVSRLLVPSPKEFSRTGVQ